MNDSQIVAVLKKTRYKQLTPYQRRMKLAVEEGWKVELDGTYSLTVPFYASRRAFYQAVAAAFEPIMVFRSDQRRFVVDMLESSDSLKNIHVELAKARTQHEELIKLRVDVYRRVAARSSERWIYRVDFDFYEREFNMPGMEIKLTRRWQAALNYLDNHFPEGPDKEILRCVLKKGLALGAHRRDMWFSHPMELLAIFREAGMSPRMRETLEPFLLYKNRIPRNRMMFIRVHERLSAFTDPKNASIYDKKLRQLLEELRTSMNLIQGYLGLQQSYKPLGLFERHYYGVVIVAVMHRQNSPKATFQSRTAAYSCLGPHGPLRVGAGIWERLEKGYWD